MNRVIIAAALIWFVITSGLKAADDALPSWNEGQSKSAITSFVVRVTKEGSPDFVPPGERIAVFDNDGTLWCEQPIYSQLAFVLDRVKALAPEHPEWKDRSPFKEVLAGDVKAALAGGDKAIVGLMMATHAGMTTDAYEATVRQWLKTARHPRFKRPYNQCVYQPMIEVLDYMRANGFRTFIVSGGGIEFMRVWADQAYGIPPDQVVGSAGKLKYEIRDGQPHLLKLPEIDFIDDHAGKPVGIEQHIGRRPILAFGNSDGDFEMLEWTTTSARPHLGLLVHHTDAAREYAYDRDSPVGQLKRGLDEAANRGWILIDMQREWKMVFKEDR